jgi:3-oxoacyl-[acyl-carrier protein] reductase
MNLFGTVYSCNAVAPIMKQQRSGKIITVSSVAGTAPSADGGYAHYGAAKAAIAHYTRYLAQDLGPFGITANCIAPGVIATGRIMATVIPGSIQSNRDRAELVALRRLGLCAKMAHSQSKHTILSQTSASLAQLCFDLTERHNTREALSRGRLRR